MKKHKYVYARMLFIKKATKKICKIMGVRPNDRVGFSPPKNKATLCGAGGLSTKCRFGYYMCLGKLSHFVQFLNNREDKQCRNEADCHQHTPDDI